MKIRLKPLMVATGLAIAILFAALLLCSIICLLCAYVPFVSIISMTISFGLIWYGIYKTVKNITENDKKQDI